MINAEQAAVKTKKHIVDTIIPERSTAIEAAIEAAIIKGKSYIIMTVPRYSNDKITEKLVSYGYHLSLENTSNYTRLTISWKKQMDMENEEV